MKPLSLVSIVFFSLVSNLLQGQYLPMVEEGKYWIYLNHWDEDHPAAVSGHAITFEGDTTINSLIYKKVYRQGLSGRHNCPHPPCFQFDIPYETTSKSLIAFIREDTISKKVFNLPILEYGFCERNEHLLFDYALEIGDTLNACLYEFVGGGFENYPVGIVDSINVTDRFGKSRNTIFTTGVPLYGGLGYYAQVLILEGVGLENYGIFHSPLSYLHEFCEGGMEACGIISSNTPVDQDKEVNVFPNPTTGSFTVTVSDVLLKASYTIVDCTGRVTHSFKLNEPNSTAHLNAPGIYFWRIELDGRLINSGKLVCN